MNKELELEAEEYANQINKNWFGMKLPEKNKDTKKDFIAGAKSEAAKEYWYKQFEKQKLEFAIEIIKDMDKKCFGGSNTCKAKIQELEQKLSEL